MELDCSAVPADQPGSLIGLWRGQRIVGASVIKLVGVDWSDPGVRSRVLELLGEPDADDQVLWVEREAGCEDWCGGNIWWVLDGSALLGASARATAAIVQAMPYAPAITELVVRRPARASLNPASLDELAGRVGADHSWLYVEPADLDVATNACARCDMVWGVRSL